MKYKDRNMTYFGKRCIFVTPLSDNIIPAVGM